MWNCQERLGGISAVALCVAGENLEDERRGGLPTMDAVCRKDESRRDL